MLFKHFFLLFFWDVATHHARAHTFHMCLYTREEILNSHFQTFVFHYYFCYPSLSLEICCLIHIIISIPFPIEHRICIPIFDGVFFLHTYLDYATAIHFTFIFICFVYAFLVYLLMSVSVSFGIQIHLFTTHSAVMLAATVLFRMIVPAR